VDALDPSAVAFASRLASDRWFCWEQPDRGGFALAGVGAASEVVSRGPDRFDDVESECAEIARDRIAAEPTDIPPGTGPVWVGGFAFSPEGGRAPLWSSLPPALVVMPELMLARVELDRGFEAARRACASDQGLAGGLGVEHRERPPSERGHA